MATVLISFIGKGWPDEKGQGDKHTGYKTATYAFAAEADQPGGEVKTALFGAALLNRLQALKRPVEKWLVMGTEQSMWDALYVAAAEEDVQIELLNSAAFAQLREAVKQGNPKPANLTAWQEIMSSKLNSTNCFFHLVGPADTQDSQHLIWQALTEAVAEGDEIILDVTNGLRHQPVIASFMVMLLRWLKNINRIDLYYGALDMAALNQGKAPVVKLSLCNDILEATEAVATYKHTGNYSALVQCLNTDGNLEQNFQTLIYRDGIQRDVTALAHKLNKDLHNDQTQADSIGQSLRAALSESLTLAADKRLSERLKGKAQFAFKHKNYFQAIALLWEAILVAQCEKHNLGDSELFGNRDKASDELKQELNYLTWSDTPTGWPVREVFEKVAHLRNAVLHGTRGEYAEINRILDSETEFRKVFQAGLRLFDYVAPRKPAAGQ